MKFVSPNLICQLISLIILHSFNSNACAAAHPSAVGEVESQLAYMWEVTSFTGLNNISTITDTASTSQLYIPPGRLSPDAQYTFTCQAIPPVLSSPSKVPLDILALNFPRNFLVQCYTIILVLLCLVQKAEIRLMWLTQKHGYYFALSRAGMEIFEIAADAPAQKNNWCTAVPHSAFLC